MRVAILSSGIPPRITPCGYRWPMRMESNLCQRPGISLEMLLLVLNNVSLQFVTPKSGSYGHFNGTHWNGLVGLLHRKEADISVPILTQTSQRLQYIDFSSQPIIYIQMIFAINAPKVLPVQGIWAPFEREVWISFISAFLVCGLVCSLGRGFYVKGKDFSNYFYGVLFNKRSKTLWVTGKQKVVLQTWNLACKFATLYFAAAFVRNCSPRIVPSIAFTNVDQLAEVIGSHGYRWVSASLGYSTIRDVLQSGKNESSLHRDLR